MERMRLPSEVLMEYWMEDKLMSSSLLPIHQAMLEVHEMDKYCSNSNQIKARIFDENGKELVPAYCAKDVTGQDIPFTFEYVA